MDLLRVVRAVGGLLTIVVLLALVTADFVYASLNLTNDIILLLVGIISSLLGVDMAIDKGLSVNITKSGEKNKDDS